MYYYLGVARNEWDSTTRPSRRYDRPSTKIPGISAMKAYGPSIIWPPSMNAAGPRPRLGNSIAPCCAAATLTTSTGVCNNGWRAFDNQQEG